jgi:hypothetical protein
MSIIEDIRLDTCVYWALKSNESGGLAYDNFGQPLHTDPVELDCRWDDVAEEIIGKDGTRVMSKAQVYLEDKPDKGGMLYHGTLAELPSGYTTPRDIDEAWEIRMVEVTPTIDYEEELIIAYL